MKNPKKAVTNPRVPLSVEPVDVDDPVEPAEIEAPEVSMDKTWVLENDADGKKKDRAAVQRSAREYVARNMQAFESWMLSGEEPGPEFNEAQSRNRYVLGEVISRSEMSVVYQAEDTNIHRQVVMKVLLADRRDSHRHTARIRRFFHEAQVTGQLEHPHIVPVHEFGVNAQGNAFYTMKKVRGVTLKSVLDDLHAGDATAVRRYPLHRLLSILLKVCDGVRYAHSRSVVHRDLKPENIMIGDFGEVFVMDWGVSKVLSPEESEFRGISELEDNDGHHPINLAGQRPLLETFSGTTVGTPVFMAPEQADPEKKVDARADVYALGGILYQMLALDPPLTNHNLRLLLRAKERGDISPPDRFNGVRSLPHCPGGRVPHALSAVSMKALAPEPKERYAGITELQADIVAYLDGFATTAESAGIFRLVGLSFQRNASHFIVAGFAFVFLAGIIGVAVNRVLEAQREAQEALIVAAGIARPTAHSQAAFAKAYQAKVLGEVISLAYKGLKQANSQVGSWRFDWHIETEGIVLDIGDNPGLHDISALSQLPLSILRLQNTAVADLTPLQQMALLELDLQNCPVKDLAGLSGMPLRKLDLRGTAVTDLSPLLNCRKLTLLLLPESAKNPAVLRRHPALRYLSYTTPAESVELFWQNHPSVSTPPPPLSNTAPTPSPTPPTMLKPASPQ